MSSVHLVLLFSNVPCRPSSPQGCDFVQAFFVQSYSHLYSLFSHSILYPVEKIPWCSYGNYRQVKFYINLTVTM